MNPTISQMLVQAHQAQLFAEAAATRLAATAERSTGPASHGRTTARRQLVATFASRTDAVAH